MMQALSLRLLANWSFAQDNFNANIETRIKQGIDTMRPQPGGLKSVSIKNGARSLLIWR
jgi:hypothetical protein